MRTLVCNRNKIASALAVAVATAVLVCVRAAAAQDEPSGDPAAGQPAAATGSLKGKITFAGKAPKPAHIEPRHDSGSCGHHGPIIDESLLVSKRGGVANVVVFLEGVAADGGTPRPAELKQRNCAFVPHVQTVTAGAKLTISNGDSILHNVHAFIGDETLFNLAMPVRGLRIDRTLDTTGIVSIRCDSGHTWMRSYIVIVPHRFHAVSGRDGSFSIAGIPAGEYTMEVWHERLGRRQQSVTISGDRTTEAAVEYEDTSQGQPQAAVEELPPTVTVPALDQRLGELEDALTGTIEETKTEVYQLEERRLADLRTQIAAAARPLYLAHCAPCHGAPGDGAGPAAKFLEHPPRDFRKGEFEFRMTPSGMPATETDLFRTISVGIPGTAMPSWRRKLSRAERKLLARYVMTFSDRFWKRSKRPITPIEIPEETPNDKASVARGRELYKQMKCAQCHGEGGRGDGPASATTKDDWGNRILPWDFTKGYFQGGHGAAVVYRALSTGLSGTPMPSFADVLEAEQRWDLVHYILSLADPGGAGSYLFSAPAGRRSPQ